MDTRKKTYCPFGFLLAPEIYHGNSVQVSIFCGARSIAARISGAVRQPRPSLMDTPAWIQAFGELSGSAELTEDRAVESRLERAAEGRGYSRLRVCPGGPGA